MQFKKRGAAVFGALTVLAGLVIGTSLTVGSNLTVTGAISGNVPNTAIATMASATTTPCAILNSSGSTRTITAIGATEKGTSASLGSITVVAGTSTSAFGTTHATNFIDTTITKVSGVDIISTTSSAISTYEPWRTGEYIVFSSGTTTHAGACRVLYY